MDAWGLVAGGDQMAFTRCYGQRHNGELRVRRQYRGRPAASHDWRTLLSRRSTRDRNGVIDDTSRIVCLVT